MTRACPKSGDAARMQVRLGDGCLPDGFHFLLSTKQSYSLRVGGGQEGDADCEARVSELTRKVWRFVVMNLKRGQSMQCVFCSGKSSCLVKGRVDDLGLTRVGVLSGEV